jgi:ADP-heptose:LPS heptosyltransferase
METALTAIRAVRLGGLGDLLVVLPSLNLLRLAFPGRRLALRCRPSSGALLRGRGVLDEVISADAAERSADPFGLDVGWFQKASSVPDAPGRYFVFDPSAGTAVSRYFFDRTFGLVRESGFTEEPDFAACARLPGARPAVRSGPVVIHPGSGSVRKCWPLERFLALAEALSRRGFDGRFVTGEADARLAAGIRGTALPPRWDLRESPALDDLAAWLESAPLYVGNDSGVTHLAAACGAPAVALFREEFAVPWRPTGRTEVLAAEAVEGIPLEDAVAAAVRAASSAGEKSCDIINGSTGER